MTDLYKRFIAGAEKHPNYKQTVEQAHRLTVHADGEVPDKLINERRPYESEKIKDYRRKIYVPITKNPINKVSTSLQKIRRSSDWAITYDQRQVPAILGENTLENYCEKAYPMFTSVTNWVFSEALKCYLLDANGVYAAIPREVPENAADYVSPVAYFFPSSQVYAYRAGEYAVLLSSESSRFVTVNVQGGTLNSKVFYVLTCEQITRYEQNTEGSYTVTMDYAHGLGYLPCDKAGGLFKARRNDDIIFESRIDVMIPSLDEAAREYSDLQAEVVMNVFSEKYEYVTEECAVCHGSGAARDDDGKIDLCHVCNGSGRLAATSPYGVYQISLQRKLENYQIPEVPIGYVQKSTEIARLQDERVKGHLFAALAAVNMEFLAETPLSQSGVAKEVDRDELNNFVHSIAEDVVRIMDNIYKWICDLRYSVILPNPDLREALLPVIAVPENYDLLSSKYIMTEIANLHTANANPLTVAALEVDFIRKKFNANPAVSNRLAAVLELDPLPCMEVSDKITYESAGVVRRVDLVISANMQRFITKAFDEFPDFEQKTYAQKMEILEKYAEELAAALEPVDDEPLDDEPADEPVDEPLDPKSPKSPKVP